MVLKYQRTVPDLASMAASHGPELPNVATGVPVNASSANSDAPTGTYTTPSAWTSPFVPPRKLWTSFVATAADRVIRQIG
jgi:hypothetical protein